MTNLTLVDCRECGQSFLNAAEWGTFAVCGPCADAHLARYHAADAPPLFAFPRGIFGQATMDPWADARTRS